ncbi:MAG: M48 family metallopeptidase [Limisphaerales bacterium]
MGTDKIWLESKGRFAQLKSVTSDLILVPLNFLVAGGMAFGLNWLAAIPWRKAALAHWTERARLLWPVRKSAGTGVLLIPLCLSFAEVAAKQVTLAGGVVPAIAGFLGAMLGTYPLDREILPRFTFYSWLRLVTVIWTLRLVFLTVFVVGGVLMPEEPGVAMAAIAGGVLLFVVAWNWGLFMRSLRAMGLLQVPDERLRGIVTGTARRMGVGEPVTWLLDVPLAYAAALPTTGELMFSTRLLEILSDEEISSISAHELAHLSESKSVLAGRIAGSMTFYPVIFARPAVHFGLSGMGTLVGLVVLAMILARKLSRRMEKRADKIATENQGQEGVYARALEKLYRDSLIPAVSSSNRQIHPHLYDRMLAAGILPEYPRPAKPERMAWPGYLLWIAYLILIGFAFRK